MAATNDAGDHVRSGTASVRQYLNLRRLTRIELPHHPSFVKTVASNHSTSLAGFFNDLFTEVQQINFDQGFIERGKWKPKDGSITMPPLDFSKDGDSKVPISVPVSVDKRIKPMNNANWLARTSKHSDAHVTLPELGELLCHEHSRNEAVYTPSVYDANELLSWDEADLLKALRESNHGDKINSVEMSIFQMFHLMPKVLGLSMLEDRVFHVLAVTARSYRTENPSELSHSFTVQLPIDYNTFSDVELMTRRSHVKVSRSSRCYHVPSGEGSAGTEPGDDQRKRQGKKLTEGNYVSLERLVGAPRRVSVDAAQQVKPTDGDDHHRWDMMTLSTAEGMTRKAPDSIQQKETLVAIAKDVEYVLKHIAKQRQGKLGQARTGD